MKSRVEKNRELHKKINQSIDENVNSEALSHYANKLNEIDDNQFERMEAQVRQEPKRAKESTSNLDIFDTFENEYLKDFLDEVKAYNVKKGYRSSQDTNENILEELNLMDKEIDPVIETEENVFWEDYEPNLITPNNENISHTIEEETESDMKDDVSFEEIDTEMEDDVDFEETVEIDTLEEDTLTQEDITREILKLTDTDEVLFEEMETLSENTSEIESPIMADPIKIEDELLESFESYDNDHADSEEILDEGTVAKYRAVNAIVSVALMAALLGLAIAIRYFVLN